MSLIYLASQSPRRKALLQQLNITFQTVSADIDETPFPQESPEQLVTRLAISKAKACQNTLPDSAIILGSDTIVVSPLGDIFGKPTDFKDAHRMLTALSGAEHQVMTAIAIVKGGATWVENVITRVTFCPLSDADIEAYWQTGEPQDKAGSYGIQGIAGKFVQHIQGNYSAVVGLPLYQTNQLLQTVIAQSNDNESKI